MAVRSEDTGSDVVSGEVCDTAAEEAEARLQVPERFHDDAYERPILSRYVDPVEVVWLATARRLRLHIRRDPEVFSMTDGTGLLALSPRTDLDADDCLAQMLVHELCHWITNGVDSFHQRDWGFPLWDGVDVREHACLRLQAWWSGRHGLRDMFGPTGCFRQYYEQLPADPLAPIDESPWETAAVAYAHAAVATARQPPFWEPVEAAFAATGRIRGLLGDFVGDYASEHPDDELPLIWTRDG